MGALCLSFFSLHLSDSLTLFLSHMLFVCTHVLSRRPTGQSQQVGPVKVFLNAATHGSGPQGKPQPLIWQRKKQKWRPSLLLFLLFFCAWRVFVLASAPRPPAAPQLQPANGSTRRCDMYYAKVGRVDTTENRRLQSRHASPLPSPSLRISGVTEGGGAREVCVWGGGGPGLGATGGEGRASAGSAALLRSPSQMELPSHTCTCVYVRVSSGIREVLSCTFAFNPPFYFSASFKEMLGKAARALSRLDPLTSP